MTRSSVDFNQLLLIACLEFHGLLRRGVDSDDGRELGGVRPEDGAAEVTHGAAGELVAGDLPLLPPPVAVDGEDAVAEQVARVVAVERALAVVGEVGPEDVLHHRRVARVYEPPAGREQAEGLAAAGQVREVVVQAPEVVELVEHRAYRGRVPSPAAAAAHGAHVRDDRQQSEPGERGPGRRSSVIHGALLW